MTALLLPTVLLIIGLVLLVWSSDLFIDGAANVAKHMSISPLIIGVVVLGFGTSAPEILVAILASLDNSPGLAIGNVIGSNIANIALVLGVTAIVAPIIVKSSLLKREFPIVIGVSVVVYLLILDNNLNFVDGLILLALLIIVMTWMIKANLQLEGTDDPMAEDTIKELSEHEDIPLKKSWVMLVGGLIVLILSAKLMVWGAIDIAHFFKVPDIIIGLTIVAIGTSLPELAAAITAAKKGESDLMIGNILGSNLFNLLAVMAMPALLAPSVMDKTTLAIDYPIMLLLTFAMLFVALPRNGESIINRKIGILFMLSFVAYLVSLYFRTVGI
jgi:cation:H+ antiporter